jgi:hypothetical protein
MMFGKLNWDFTFIAIFIGAMLISRSASIALFGLMLLLAFGFSIAIYAALKLYNDGVKMDRQDISATNPPIEGVVRPVAQKLLGLGFTWFGAQDYMGNIIHHFIDPQRTMLVIAMKLDDKSMIIATESYLERDYLLSYGLALDTPLPYNVDARHVRQWVQGGSLEDLIATHRVQMERLQFNKGNPVVFQNMMQYTEHMRIYRASFGREVYFGLVFWNAVLPILWAIGYIVLVLRLMYERDLLFGTTIIAGSPLSLALDMLTQPGDFILGGGVLLLSAALLLRWLAHDVFLWIQIRKTRAARQFAI